MLCHVKFFATHDVGWLVGCEVGLREKRQVEGGRGGEGRKDRVCEINV